MRKRIIIGTTRHVEDYMLRELMLEGKNRYFDSEICQNMDISDSEIEELCKSLKETAIRELIANAVAHRSYLEPGNIQVALYDDRLELTSPGMLLNNVTIEKMIEGYSRPRNPAIARAFAYMKIIEKWGTGIPRLFAACEEYGLPKPELIDFDGDFRVNMYRKRDTNTKTGDQTCQPVNDGVNDEVNKLLNYLNLHPDYTVTQFAEHFEVSRKTIAARLKKLKDKGYIERVGSSRKGYWKVN